MDIVALFYDMDKFAVEFEPPWRQRLLADGKGHRNRAGRMRLSEVMTILVLFHHSDYCMFKHFYLEHVCRHMWSEFPSRLCYGRFVEQVPRALTAFLQTRFVPWDGISFVNSVALRVCHYFGPTAAR